MKLKKKNTSEARTGLLKIKQSILDSVKKQADIKGMFYAAYVEKAIENQLKIDENAKTD